MDDFENLNVEYVKDRKVCATGRLLTLTHAELGQLVSACGGQFVRTPSRSSLILVVGDGGWPTAGNGHAPNQIFDRARRLKAYGYNIDITGEVDFLERLGFRQSAGAIRGPHTIGDLSRILNISAPRLRRWVRVGLLRPVQTQFQIPYFDFHQVSFIRQLHELVEGGTSPAELRRGMDEIKELLPHGESLEALWSNIERDGRVLIRWRDRLIDQTGQRYFDFDASGENQSTIFAQGVEAGFHDLCDQGLALEEDGQLTEAAAAYRRALELKPDHPTLHFDLGNVLFQLGEYPQSLRHFQEAVSHDDEFAMAWHNMGCVYVQRENWDEAEAALCRALSLVPTYADSHSVLADVLRKLNRPLAAARHERAYHEYSKAENLLASRAQLLRVVHADDEERQSS